MARLTRLDLPNTLHHVCIRGNNGEPIARAPQDLDVMRELWLEISQAKGIKVHGYAFLAQSVQALLTPTQEGALSGFMQGVGRRYVQYFNRLHGRSGTLWEGRFRSNVLQAEPWLLKAMVYIDGLCEGLGLQSGVPSDALASKNQMNGMASFDSASGQWLYPWSSHAHWVGQRLDPLVSAHESLWHLGNTPFEREVQYAEMVRQGLSLAQQQGIESSLKSGWPLGDAEFVANLQKTTHRRLTPKLAGRPPNPPVETLESTPLPGFLG